MSEDLFKSISFTKFTNLKLLKNLKKNHQNWRKSWEVLLENGFRFRSKMSFDSKAKPKSFGETETKTMVSFVHYFWLDTFVDTTYQMFKVFRGYWRLLLPFDTCFRKLIRILRIYKAPLQKYYSCRNNWFLSEYCFQ